MISGSAGVLVSLEIALDSGVLLCGLLEVTLEEAGALLCGWLEVTLEEAGALLCGLLEVTLEEAGALLCGWLEVTLEEAGVLICGLLEIALDELDELLCGLLEVTLEEAGVLLCGWLAGVEVGVLSGSEEFSEKTDDMYGSPEFFHSGFALQPVRRQQARIMANVFFIKVLSHLSPSILH